MLWVPVFYGYHASKTLLAFLSTAVVMAVDRHYFLSDPDSDVFLDADPDPRCGSGSNILLKKYFLKSFAVI